MGSTVARRPQLRQDSRVWRLRAIQITRETRDGKPIWRADLSEQNDLQTLRLGRATLDDAAGEAHDVTVLWVSGSTARIQGRGTGPS